MDFNDADPQKDGYELIPAGTIAPVIMSIRPGGMGDDGWQTASKNSDAMMLNCEFTVESGPYARRKLWQYLVVSGGKIDERGQSMAGKISMSLLRAILESARNVRPDDQSEAAKKARCVSGWGDFDGLTFLAKIGVEKDKTGHYNDKNKIQAAVTPDMKDYTPLTQIAAPYQGPAPQPASPAAPPVQSRETQNSCPRPSWA